MMNVAVNEARVNRSNFRCYSTGQSGNRLLFIVKSPRKYENKKDTKEK